MKIKSFIIASTVLVAFGSCKKNLEKLPTATLGEPAFWKTSNDAISAVNGIYNTLQDGYMYSDFMRHSDALTDNAYSQYSFNYYLEISQNQGFSTASVVPYQVWKSCYSGISRSNAVLANVPGIEMDNALKTRLLGEAAFFRAFFYFHLSNLWGTVPLILMPMNVSEQYVSRSSKEEIITQILADLDMAEKSLPKTYAGSDIGRVTHIAATTLKSRVYLYNKKWSEAAAAASKVISTSGLGLVAGSAWADMFLPAGKNSKIESIFEVQFLGGTGSGLGNNYNNASGALPNSPNTYVPEQDLLSAFEAGDIRASATILTPGETFAGQSYTGANSPTKLAIKKSVIPDATITSDGGSNFIVFRFAEVLLTYAEAQNELLSTPDQSVYDAVNKVRNRAGLASLTTGLTKDQMRAAIKRERRLEFAFEGQHFFDLLRWGGTDYKAAMDAVTGDVTGDTRTYDPKLLLWPVPQNEVNINKSLLPQNPGW